MANWVTNGLNIQGPAEDISRVKFQLGRAFTRGLPLDASATAPGNQRKEVTFSNPVFSLWNIVNPYTENSSHEAGQAVTRRSVEYNSEWFERASGTVADVAVADGDQSPTTLLNVETDTGLSYQFDTAWSDCRRAIGALATLYPSFLITYDFEYPEGESGSISFAGIQITVLEGYRWKCSWCDHIENDEPPEECPNCGEANDNF